MSKLTLKTEGDRYVVVTRRFAAPPEADSHSCVPPGAAGLWTRREYRLASPVCVSYLHAVAGDISLAGNQVLRSGT